MTQDQALSIMKMGHNVFLTGNAGSGKTYVLNRYINYLKEHDIPVAITASTGIAATHIGGVTIHAWSGMGIKDRLNAYEIEQLEERQYLWDRYTKTKVLIIDEVSMISGIFLDTLDLVCKSMKRSFDEPFGGMQIILCGDLLQLPPVTKGSPYDDTSTESNLICDSQAWRQSKIVPCYLTEQHRQHDPVFTKILNTVRTGELGYDVIDLIEERITDYDHEIHGSMTKLFTHNRDVDALNLEALAAIEGDTETYHMTTRGKANLVETLMKGCLAQESITLKIGAEVMFIKNNPEKGYVNGTRGVVTNFSSDKKPIVTTRDGDTITVQEETWSIDDEGKILASLTQIPLRHAWAITVHKSQGMSLDEAVVDLSRSFSYGMGYVALSRVRSLSGLHLIGFSRESLLLDPRLLSMDQTLRTRSEDAVGRLEKISRDDLEKRHHDFITRSGGSLEPIDITPKNNSRKYGTFGSGNVKTYEKTYELVSQGKTIKEVASERGLVVGTIIDHLSTARELGKDIGFKHIKPDRATVKIIKDAFTHTKDKGISFAEAKLTPVKRYLDKAGYNYDFDTIKLVRLFLG